jgi:hypothetical protein
MITEQPSAPCEAERLRAERSACLILHVPQWFQRGDFLDWRQGQVPHQWEAPATWNPDCRDGPNHDVFVVFDRRPIDDTPEFEPVEGYLWEGSDLAGLPDDIYQAIGTVLAERRLRYGVLWLKPD